MRSGDVSGSSLAAGTVHRAASHPDRGVSIDPIGVVEQGFQGIYHGFCEHGGSGWVWWSLTENDTLRKVCSLTIGLLLSSSKGENHPTANSVISEPTLGSLGSFSKLLGFIVATALISYSNNNVN